MEISNNESPKTPYRLRLRSVDSTPKYAFSNRLEKRSITLDEKPESTRPKLKRLSTDHNPNLINQDISSKHNISIKSEPIEEESNGHTTTISKKLSKLGNRKRKGSSRNFRKSNIFEIKKEPIQKSNINCNIKAIEKEFLRDKKLFMLTPIVKIRKISDYEIAKSINLKKPSKVLNI